MLSRGAFVTYFGGPDLLNQLDERSGSIVRYCSQMPQPLQNDKLISLMMMAISLLYQLSVNVFKKFKTYTFDPNQQEPGLPDLP